MTGQVNNIFNIASALGYSASTRPIASELSRVYERPQSLRLLGTGKLASCASSASIPICKQCSKKKKKKIASASALPANEVVPFQETRAWARYQFRRLGFRGRAVIGPGILSRAMVWGPRRRLPLFREAEPCLFYVLRAKDRSTLGGPGQAGGRGKV